jgi:PRTRC genetic system ThiF family protein
MKRVFKAPASWLDNAIQIDVIGCGGTGSSMLDELFRMHSLLVRLDHPGLVVTAWDGDTVTEANVGRQRFWPCDIGWNKAELLINRYNSFGDTQWYWHNRMLTAEDAKALRPDVLITCVDTPTVRVMVGEVGRKRTRTDALWLDTGNDANSGQVVLGHWSKEPATKDQISLRLPNVLDLYPGLKNQKDGEGPSCSVAEAISRQDFGINQRVAGEASGLLWRLVRHGQIDRHGSFIYQESGEVLPLYIDEEQWRSFAA